MARRSTSNVPLSETSSTRTLGSTTDDRLNASANGPETVSVQRPSMPGTSRSCPIEVRDDEDADCTKTPVKQIRQIATIRDDPTRLRPSSAQKSRSPEQPKTPGRSRPQPQRETASDPGLRRPTQDAFQDGPIAYVQNGKLPCGRRPYARPGGACHERHRSGCKTCYSQPSEQVGGEEVGSDDVRILPTRPAASSNPAARSDSIEAQAQDHSTDTVEAEPQTARANGDNSAPLVHHRLLQAAKQKLTADEKKGYIYIFKCAERPGLLKLGCSANPPRREDQHRQRCGLATTWVHVSNCAVNMKRAEKLAKLDLRHVQKDYRCSSCSQTHTEFFQVDEQRAKHVADRWVAWINDHKPYAADGSLTPMWAWLLDFPRAPRPAFATLDHAARWAHWDAALLAPSRRDARAFADLAEAPPASPTRRAAAGRRSSAAAADAAETPPSPAATQNGNTYHHTTINKLVVRRDFVGSAG